MGSSARSIVAMLPTGPGVYRFRDARNRTLYIGRAVSLRRRVASYWGDLGDRPHLTAMVRSIDRVEAVSCDSDTRPRGWSVTCWNGRSRGGT